MGSEICFVVLKTYRGGKVDGQFSLFPSLRTMRKSTKASVKLEDVQQSLYCPLIKLIWVSWLTKSRRNVFATNYLCTYFSTQLVSVSQM